MVPKAIEFILKSELYKHTETKEYLQKKVIKLEKSQNKSLKQIHSLNSKVTKLHKKHISKVNSYGRKLSIVNNAKLKSVIIKIIKENKKEFSLGFKLLTTQMIQAGTTSIRSTIKEAKLFYEFITRKPDDTFLSPNHCLTFLSDNTNYMSGAIGGAVVKFNQISESKKHPFNLLYLAWELHNGYNKSNKESPLEMKAKYIQSLYQLLLEQSFSKYQQLLRTRWFYELEAAQQYLKR
ncbi:hypothetical protein RhiirA5_411352 [Rhizophagus irregularis]|uniref:Uncharacterized protein n=1 Tax=Rhizophagus irregularis TaxID=588596 RepID=A0A2N0Q1B9_9GLOM|nr:hypothetical protein RhiirA5_411352 [Rhizophagus irregularis]